VQRVWISLTMSCTRNPCVDMYMGFFYNVSGPSMWISLTGWRRLIGSPMLQIIFHKRATKYRSLLWKMTHKDKGSYESLPRYVYISL